MKERLREINIVRQWEKEIERARERERKREVEKKR